MALETAHSRAFSGLPPPESPPNGEESPQSLLAQLENRTRTTVQINGTGSTFDHLTEPDELHARALALITERIPQIT